MKYCARTDKGSVRDINEDYYKIITGCSDNTAVFIIADGMGGHNAGEVASKTSAEHIAEMIDNNPEIFIKASDIQETIRELITGANRVVYEKSLELTENHGMGTTLIMAVFDGNLLHIGHVGDSRLYLVRNNEIKCITTDHSYIEELVRNGSLTREEARTHPKRNIITRALGGFGTLEVDTYSCNLEKGDCIIMCTDGLTNLLDEEEIKETVNANHPEIACEKLIDGALQKGGDDNITVIVIKNE